MRTHSVSLQTRPGYVWWPALHYGLAYTVFALVTRSVWADAVSEPDVFAAGFAAGGLPVLAWSLQRARARRRQRMGPPVRATLPSVVSGLAALAIVVTTVLAFLFEDVSILLALVLMRLGVLLMAPVIDLLTQRALAPPVVLAGLLCVIGCIFGTVSNAFTPLSPPVLGVLCVYLAGYGVRLTLMTRYAKGPDRTRRGDWFVTEVRTVALGFVAAIILGGAAIAFQGMPGGLGLEILFASLMAGAAYSYAFVHGTLIYLDWRENTRAVTVNRSVSLLSGVAASLIAWRLWEEPLPTVSEWTLALLVGAALIALSRG